MSLRKLPGPVIFSCCTEDVCKFIPGTYSVCQIMNCIETRKQSEIVLLSVGNVHGVQRCCVLINPVEFATTKQTVCCMTFEHSVQDNWLNFILVDKSGLLI